PHPGASRVGRLRVRVPRRRGGRPPDAGPDRQGDRFATRRPVSPPPPPPGRHHSDPAEPVATRRPPCYAAGRSPASSRGTSAMKHALALAAALLACGTAAGKPPPTPLAAGLKNPESVVVGTNGKVYATVIGEFNVDGDGVVVVIDNGKVTPYV